jgi:Tol biopolymer transport system component
MAGFLETGLVLRCRVGPCLTVVFGIVLTPVTGPAQSTDAPNRSSVYELKADGTGWNRLFDVPEFESLGSPNCSADGQWLAFDGCRTQKGETWSQSHMFACRLDGTDLRDLGTGAMPTWSPDGQQFACSRNEDGAVWIMETARADGRCLDSEGWGIAWSPASTSVVYARRGNLVIHDTATGASRELFGPGESPYGRIYWNMTCSADGKQVAFLGHNTADQKYEIAVIDAQGPEFGFKVCFSSMTQISANLAWHPQGKRLVFPRQSPEHQVSQLYEVDPTHDGPSVLVPGQPHDRHNVSMCWTPDGDKLIVISRPK